MTAVASGRLLIGLDGRGCSAAEVGGKGAGLDRLAAHGFPIPRSFALPADAYRLAVAEAGLEGWLADIALRPPPEPSLLDAEEAEIGERFAAIGLPDPVESQIVAAATALLRRGRVAVRSSATAEDQRGASFAGQYRSYTELDSVDAVIEAVKWCWASLWAPSAREYRKRHDIDQGNLAMAVVIQAMVEAVWSGVGFTRDPASNDDRMRVEAVPGAGGPLVSGAVTPLDFTIDRTTLAVTTSRGGEPPPFLENLARMLLRVEAELDAPQDVEWSWTPEGIMLLQARPVTVGPTAALDDGFDRPVDSEDTFTPHGVIEMLPGVVPPLLWTINAPMVESGFRNVVADLGGPAIPAERPFVGRFRGRAVLNLSALRAVAEAMPGGSAAAVEEQFLGRSLSAEGGPRRRAGRRRLRRARTARSALTREVELVCGAADAIVELGAELEGLPAKRLLAYGYQVRDLAWRITAAEVAASSAAAAAYQALQLLLARWVDREHAAPWAQRLTAGGLEGEVAGTRLHRLLTGIWQDQILPHRDLALAVRTLPPDRVETSLGTLGDRGRRVIVMVRAAARLAGSKAVYGGQAWDEDPGDAWSQLAEIARASTQERAPRGNPSAELAAEITARRGWRAMRILTGQIVDLRLRWIQHQAGEATAWLRRRERAKTALLTLGGEERRIIAEYAARLAASGHLTDPEDIELHTDGEVRAMMLGAGQPAPATVLWRRRAVQRCRHAAALPELFVGAPEQAPLPATSVAGTLAGWAASPGRVSGTARVIAGLAAAGALRPGDVLVAQATDPSWTPVLARAGALVLETGGPLSHGAIVARELGIPAVLCVPGATRYIADGEMVEVDGYSGVVNRVAATIQEAV